MKKLFALVVSLLAAGCATRQPAVVAVVAAPARPATAPILVAEQCADDELARRVAIATAALPEGTSVRVELQESSTTLECMLRARRADAKVGLEGSGGQTVVRAWKDASPEATSVKDLNFIAPMGPAERGKWSHIVITPATEARDRRADLEYRLAKAGFLPWASGLEVLNLHDDGSADVRVLGYPHLQPEDGPTSWSLTHLWIASLHPSLEFIALRPSSAVQPELLAIAKRTHHEVALNHKVFGPPHSHRDVDLVTESMHVAVGTCDQQWIQPIAVVLRGRLRPGTASESLEVESIEQTLTLSTWTALAPRYTKAMKDLSNAAARKAPAEALTITRNFHRDVRRAYGTAANLLELDVLLRRLELAFEHESFDEAIRALDQTRCTLPSAEASLRDAAAKH